MHDRAQLRSNVHRSVTTNRNHHIVRCYFLSPPLSGLGLKYPYFILQLGLERTSQLETGTGNELVRRTTLASSSVLSNASYNLFGGGDFLVPNGSREWRLRSAPSRNSEQKCFPYRKLLA